MGNYYQFDAFVPEEIHSLSGCSSGGGGDYYFLDSKLVQSFLHQLKDGLGVIGPALFEVDYLAFHFVSTLIPVGFDSISLFPWTLKSDFGRHCQKQEARLKLI